MEPTIYKRPKLYSSFVQKRYSCYKGLGVYKLPYGTPQGWTNQNVPAGFQITHDFGDGLGPVPAIPVDNVSITDNIERAILKQSGKRESDNVSITDNIERAILKQSGKRGSDNASITDNIISMAVIT